MLNRRFFTAQIEKRGLSQAKLAEILGISTTAISLKLAGHRKFTIKEITKLSMIFLVSREELLQALGYEDTKTTGKGSELQISGLVNDSCGIVDILGDIVESQINGAVSAVRVMASNAQSGFTYILGAASKVNKSPMAVVTCGDSRHLVYITSEGYQSAFTMQPVKLTQPSLFQPVLAMLPTL